MHRARDSDSNLNLDKNFFFLNNDITASHSQPECQIFVNLTGASDISFFKVDNFPGCSAGNKERKWCKMQNSTH